MSKRRRRPRRSSVSLRVPSRSLGAEKSPSPEPRRRIRSVSREKALSLLSDLDREFINLLSEHRVVTTQQIHALTGVPERTIRYRLDRLWKHGLCGGIQPYAPIGSAPYHWYPSRLADAHVRGAPLPKGGEKEDPSESRLEHAAAITGLYAALSRLGASLGWEVARFAREAEGREAFRAGGRESAVVPDASLVLRSGEAQWHALVEIDLGTMSMTRLSTKLGLYLAWARSGAWRAEHSYLPPLLFLTTTARRVDATLQKFRLLVAREERCADTLEEHKNLERFAIGVCEYVRAPEATLTEPVWIGRNGEDGLTLSDLLRPPFERWHAQERAARERERAWDEHCERMLTDPEAHRGAIHERWRDRPARSSRARVPSDEYGHHLLDLGAGERAALEDLIDSEEPMTHLERQAYRYFLRRTRIHEDGDPGATYERGDTPFSEKERAAVGRLIPLLLERERDRVAALWARHPMLACVLRWVRALDEGTLLSGYERRDAEEYVRADLERLEALAVRTVAYKAWREGEARRRRERLSALRKIGVSFAQALREVDEEHLRVCALCAVLCVPGIEPDRGPRWGLFGPRCEFCSKDDDPLTLSDAQARGLIAAEGDFYLTCPVSVPEWLRARRSFLAPERIAAKEEPG